MAKFPNRLKKKLLKREEENSLRTLSLNSDLIDFSSNDYLGFARDYLLKQMAQDSLDTSAENGATGSRLLTGNHKVFEELEAILCQYHKAESALVFNSGYDANLGFFSSVPQRNDIIFYDEFCHASIRDGIQLGNAKSIKFKHNDLADLKKKIERSSRAPSPEPVEGQSRSFDNEAYVVTESVFSMDGDSPDLQKLAKFCAQNELHLIVDEAHAVGVFENGLVNQLRLENEVFARIITFGKALGSHGAAILGSQELRTYLINFARSLIYSTALSPHSVAMVKMAYQLLKHQKSGIPAIKKLHQNITFFKNQVDRKGLNPYFGESDSAIQVCHLGGNWASKGISEALKNEGFDVRAILAPTVPKGKERLRFCIHSFNTKEELEEVLEILKKEV